MRTKKYGKRVLKMISVVLAAYKGEKYIYAQVESILNQLGVDDELIVSDDCPDGETAAALGAILNDNRVIYLSGPGRGVVRNFEFGILKARGDYIFLADQDDVWLDNKVEIVLRAFSEGADLVLHNAIITDGDLNKTEETAFEINHTQMGLVRNIVKNSYQGCCMAFKSEMKQYILPFPKRLPMHDQWIGLMGEEHGKVSLIEEPLLLYRRHGGNVSGNGSSTLTKIKWRAEIISAIINRRIKRK